MGTLRFESNDVLNGKPGKVIHFDSSYQRAISQKYGNVKPETIHLKNQRTSKRGETVWDVYGRTNQAKQESKLGELFHHSPDWPGGPAARKVLSVEGN